jgi:hypothetical protein
MNTGYLWIATQASILPGGSASDHEIGVNAELLALLAAFHHPELLAGHRSRSLTLSG